MTDFAKAYAEPGDQVFAENATDYQRAGVFVIPVRADKTPCVRGFGQDGYKPGAGAIRRWVKDFPSANLAVLTEPSDLTVVDVDDPSQIQIALERFGDTPLQAETPSGGAHLYYRAAGERGGNLRRDGLDIDIKAGRGAYVIAPPSRNPENRREYRFTTGGLETIQDLPPIKPGSLTPANDLSKPVPEGMYGEPERDAFIAPRIREIAHRCLTYDATLDEAREANETYCYPPLTDGEIVAKVTWAWEKKCQGELYVPGDGRRFALFDLDEDRVLYQNRAALALYLHLKAHHSWKHTFAVARSPVLAKTLAMSLKTLVSARDFLMEHRFIVKTREGGKGTGDPHAFRFGSRSEGKWPGRG